MDDLVTLVILVFAMTLLLSESVSVGISLWESFCVWLKSIDRLYWISTLISKLKMCPHHAWSPSVNPGDVVYARACCILNHEFTQQIVYEFWLCAGDTVSRDAKY